MTYYRQTVDIKEKCGVITLRCIGNAARMNSKEIHTAASLLRS